MNSNSVLLVFLFLSLPMYVFAQTISGSNEKVLPAIHYLLLDDSAREVKVESVFFGQTHVMQADQDYFRLVGNRKTLIKAHVVGPRGTQSPKVEAVLMRNGKTLRLPLLGPSMLPTTFNSRPGQVQHTYNNSFTAIIPEKWIEPGLSVSVVVPQDELNLGQINIGAPTSVLMTMFDVHYFALTPGDYPNGWQRELEAKLPVAELNLTRIPNIVFEELIVPARKDVGAPVIKASSKQDYIDQTGLSRFDGEQATALQWNRALKLAAGIRGRTSLYYTNIYGVAAGGQAGGFAGVGNGKSEGVLHHELGHAFSLPHWTDTNGYPYVGDSLGITAPNTLQGKGVHAGPTWAYDLPSRIFIPPTVQENNAGGRIGGEPVVVGEYKADPMQGGGTGDQEQGFILRHFSDYSVNQMRDYMERHVVKWNASLNSYASWDETTGNYSKTVENNGVDYATQRNVAVISLMAGVSGVSNVSLVYPPIGPYDSGLIDTFDPRVNADRQEAAAVFCPQDGCDVTLRVTQGGVRKFYLLPASRDAAVDPLTPEALTTRAINLPAANGEVTKVELLSTPDAQTNGLPGNQTILSTWSKN